MSGRQPFKNLTKDWTPERKARVQEMTKQLMAEMPLHQLRHALDLTQQDVADELNVKQPAVAKLETRTDIYLSSLRSYIEAMGGSLDIVARFPDGEVSITNFRGNQPETESNHIDTPSSAPNKKHRTREPQPA